MTLRRWLIVAATAHMLGCGSKSSSSGDTGGHGGSPADGAGGSFLPDASGSSTGGAGGSVGGVGGGAGVDGGDHVTILDGSLAVDAPAEDSVLVDGPGLPTEVAVGGMPRPMIWQLEPAGPDDGTGALGGTGPNDVWFVGSFGYVYHSTGDGQWQPRNINGPRLTGIWAAAPNDVYVSGNINAVYHWDGSGTWDHQITDSGVTFSGIWGSGPHDLYAVDLVYRSKGDRVWTHEPVTGDEDHHHYAIWGSGPNDVWTINSQSTVYHSHGDGQWVKQTTGLEPGPGVAIWGSGPHDIYALAGSVVAHSTGDGKWTVQKFDRTDEEVSQCMWGSGPNDIYIGSFSGSIFRSTGDGQWHRERLLPNDPRLISMAAIWGTSRDNVYVVTDVGTFRGRPAP
jgi:hypothetical protein